MSEPERNRIAGSAGGGVVLNVLRMERGWTKIVRTLSETYKGFLTHHVRKRSHYCPATVDCQHHAVPAVWKGYCCAEEWDQAGNLWIPRVLEITEALDQDLWGRYARGQVWELARAMPPKDKPGKTMPVRGKLLEERDPFTFPEPYDIRPPLCIMYAVPTIRLHMDNPQVRRMYVEPTKGDGPRRQGDEAPEKPSEEVMAKVRQRARGVYNPPSGNGSH